MSKKNKRIIKIVVFAVLLIVTELFFYFVVGEEKCLQKGPIRTLWLCTPLVFLIIDSLVEYLIQKSENKKQ